MTFTGRAQVLVAWSTEPFSVSPSWTDVTNWVRLDRGISMQRGRQDNLSAVQPGRMSLTGDNADGRWTAGLSSSPWAPVKIGRRIQVNVPDEHGTLHTRFDGLITELPTAWEGGGAFSSLVTVQAVDILAWLSRQPELLSWTQQEMLADAPAALWSLADSSSVTQALDQAGQGAAPLQVVSQGDGTGAAAAGSGVPLAEIITSNVQSSLQAVQTYTFANPGAVSVTLPAGTLVSCRVQCWAGGSAGTNGGVSNGAGGESGEYAEEPALAVTPGSTYTGTVGSPGSPSAGAGTNTSFAGDSVTVLAHASGSGSTNTIHFSGAAGKVGGQGASSAGPYQAGNTSGGAVTGGGAGGAAGASSSNPDGAPGSAPGGGGGGGFGNGVTTGTAGSGAAGQVIITYTYIPVATSSQNSALPSWLFTPSATLAARILSGALPQPVTASAGFAIEAWAAYAGTLAASVTTVTVPGAVSFTPPPGGITADVACWAGSGAGANGAASTGAGAPGGEYAEEPALVITPSSAYAGTVGTAGSPPSGSGGNTSFTGDSVTVLAHASGSGSTNTTHFSGGTGGVGGPGGSSGGPYQAGSSTGAAVTGGGAGGAGGTLASADASPGGAPGGGGGGGFGNGSVTGKGASGAPGQMTITVQPAASTLLTLVQPRGQYAIAIWVTTAGVLQLASTSGYGTRNPSWTTVSAGQAPSTAFHVAVCVAASTRVATLYVNGTSQGTLTLPAGATYSQVTTGGAYGSWLGGWNGSAGLLGVYPAALAAARVAAHYAAGQSWAPLAVYYDAITAAASPSAWWKLADAAGAGTAADSSGNSRSGTATSVTFGQASEALPGNTAAAFSAAVTSHVLTSYNPGPLAALTVEAWVNLASLSQGSSNPRLIANSHTDIDNHGFQLMIAAGQPQFWTGNGTANGNAAGGTVPASGWTHLAGTYDGATVKIYVNGVLQTSSAFAGTVAAGSASGIGLGYNPAYNGDYLNGLLAECAVYPAALSAAQVAAHYAASTPPSTGTMISKIAGYAGLPSFWYTPPPGPGDPSYGLTLASYYDVKGQNPLAAMQAYETAEGGVLSVSAAGVLTFADRAGRYAAGGDAYTSSYLATYGASPPLLPGQYEPDTTFKTNDQYLTTIANYATVHLPSGYPVENTAAEADYGPYAQAAGTLTSPQAAPFADATATAYVYSTDDIMDAGQWAAGVLGQPASRVPSLTVDLLTQPASEFSIASFYALDIGSALQLSGLPSQAPDVTGQPLGAYHVFEGIAETVALAEHTAQLYTSPLAQNAAWIPGDALLGVLGSTNTVGRSQAPAALGPPYPVPTFGATLNRTGSAGAQDWRGLTVNTQNRLTPPLLIAQQATAQTLATAAGQAVTFDTLLADTAAGMGTTATYTIPAGFAGWYWCAAVVQAATGTASLGGLAIWFAVRLSGVASQWHARSLPYLSAAPYTAAGISGKIGPFSAGDTIQVIAAWSGAAASLPLGTADGGSMLTLIWEGNT